MPGTSPYAYEPDEIPEHVWEFRFGFHNANDLNYFLERLKKDFGYEDDELATYAKTRNVTIMSDIVDPFHALVEIASMHLIPRTISLRIVYTLREQ